MVYLAFDTNIWIYLSNGYNLLSKKLEEELHFKLFKILEERYESNDIIILTNDLIIKEWENNKDETNKQINKFTNRLKEYKDNFLKVEKRLIDETLKQSCNDVFKSYEKLIEEDIERNKKHIEKVEEFLYSKAVKIPISDFVRKDVSNYAIEKKAPFHKNKNATSDALILFSVIEYIKNELSFDHLYDDSKLYPESYFISGNFEEFSDISNKDTIHPELKTHLTEVKMEYEVNLAKILQVIDKRPLITNEDIKRYEEEYYSQLCEFCTESYGVVEFTRPFNVFEKTNFIPTTQLSLDLKLDDGQNIKPKGIEIQLGECSRCGGHHIKCLECGEVLPIYHYGEEVECSEDCDYKFVANYTLESKGTDLEIYLVRKRRCERCNKVLDDDWEQNLCEDCEEFYNSGD